MQRSHGRVGFRAPAVAACVAAAAFCAVAAWRGTVPFGSGSRGIDDLSNQYQPFHAVLRAVLTGDGPSDLQWNWNSGGGVPFLPDYGTYLASPITLLVTLFGKDRLDTALFVLIVLRLALAAALMAMFLRRVRPHGVWWLAAALGAAYALCGWTFDDGEYQPMWLDGLAALPAVLLVGWWARERRRPVLGPLVVAVCWWSNFYSVYMASLGAVAILLVICLGEGDGAARIAATLARFAWRGLLGVALTAVVLSPVVEAVRHGQAAPGQAPHAAPWGSVAARLLPLSEGVSVSPSLFVGTAVLLLVAVVPFHGRLPRPTRIAYPVGVAVLLGSMQWPPTLWVWNAFDEPNGSPFRAAFVVCALLVITAWVSVATYLPGVRALLAATVLLSGLAVLAAAARVDVVRHDWALPVAAVVAVTTLLALTVPRTRRASAVTSGLLAVACLGVSVAEFVATGVFIENARERTIDAQPTWQSQATLHGVEARFADEGGWPSYRAAGSLGAGLNRSALVGIPGLDYYSSVISADAAATMAGLGAAWAGFGRAVAPNDEPLTALLGADRLYRYQPAEVSTGEALRVSHQPAFPMVRVLPAVPPGAAVAGNPFEARNLLVPDPVYHLPSLPGVANAGDFPGARTAGGAGTAGGARYAIAVRCAPGQLVQLHAPHVVGTWSWGAATHALRPADPRGLPRSAAGVYTLATVPPSGRVVITLRATHRTSSFDGLAVGCLDGARLARQATLAREQLADVDIHGSRIAVRWRTTVTGDAVIATARQPGWTCSVDGREAPVRSRAGLMSVPVADARAMECRYLTPGLLRGAGVSGAAAVVLAVIASVAALRRRRTTRPPVSRPGSATGARPDPTRPPLDRFAGAGPTHECEDSVNHLAEEAYS